MRRMFYLKPGEMGDHRDLESQPLLGPSSGEVTVIIIIIVIIISSSSSLICNLAPYQTTVVT